MGAPDIDLNSPENDPQQAGTIERNPIPGETIINVLPAADNDGLYLNQDGIWDDYYIHNTYFTDGHRYMLGIASPGGFEGASVAFVQTTAPTLLWQCEWTVVRWGESPLLPSPTA